MDHSNTYAQTQSVIHLIQYYYKTTTGYDAAAKEVETVQLASLRGK